MNNEPKVSRPKSVLIIMFGVMVALISLSFMIFSVTPSKFDREIKKSFKNFKVGQSGILKTSMDSHYCLEDYKNRWLEVTHKNYNNYEDEGIFFNFSKEISFF